MNFAVFKIKFHARDKQNRVIIITRTTRKFRRIFRRKTKIIVKAYKDFIVLPSLSVSLLTNHCKNIPHGLRVML